MAVPIDTCLLAVFVYMTSCFLLALVRRDNSIVDIAWGPGFIMLALISLSHSAAGSAPPARAVLVTILVAVWGVRLALHILIRKWGRGEDFRYAKWRREWGRRVVPRSFLQIFMLQGAIMSVVAWTVVLTNSRTGPGLGLLDLAGGVLWLKGFIWEAAGDAQLRRFKLDPANRGRVMDRGLWRFTRHPNYFGEALMWWGIAVIGLAVPGGWQGLVSPLILTFLLLRVSGVRMLEKALVDRRPGYADYLRRTSTFIPWFPKRPGAGTQSGEASG